MTHAEQRTRLLEATRTLLGSLAHTAPETEILQAGIQALTELMQVTYGAICLLDKHGQQSRFVHTDAGLEDRDHADHPLRCHGLLGALSLHDSSLCGNDMPRLYPQLSSLLAVPISRQGRVYGNRKE